MLRAFIMLLITLAPVNVALGAGIRDIDFSCRGVYLGDTRDKLTVFGEMLYDKPGKVFGYPITYLVYPDGEIGILPKKNIVVDIRFKDTLRSGIKKGATFHKLTKTFGKKNRTRIGSSTYLIYERKLEGRLERLMLEVENTEGYLLSWRLTMLPITEEEADAFIMSEEGKVLDDFLAEEVKIDTSGLKQTEAPRLRLTE